MQKNYDPSKHQRGKDKLAKIPVKVVNSTNNNKKPDWIRIKLKNSLTTSSPATKARII